MSNLMFIESCLSKGLIVKSAFSSPHTRQLYYYNGGTIHVVDHTCTGNGQLSITILNKGLIVGVEEFIKINEQCCPELVRLMLFHMDEFESR